MVERKLRKGDCVKERKMEKGACSDLIDDGNQ